MVAQRSPSLYELLEVSSGATFEEIEQSYQRIAAYLGAESLAVYSILDSEDAQTLRMQLDEAYRTLSDPERRAAYDRARREEQNYPPMMVPAHAGDSTSTAARLNDTHSTTATASTTHDPSAADDGYAADRSDALGAWSKDSDVHDKHLPVRGRGQPRQTIRGPGARTGRAPLYGRDVNLPPPDARGVPDVQVRERKPLYGRAQPKSSLADAQIAPRGETKPQYGRWSVRHDDDGSQQQRDESRADARDAQRGDAHADSRDAQYRAEPRADARDTQRGDAHADSRDAQYRAEPRADVRDAQRGDAHADSRDAQYRAEPRVDVCDTQRGDAHADSRDAQYRAEPRVDVRDTQRRDERGDGRDGQYRDESRADVRDGQRRDVDPRSSDLWAPPVPRQDEARHVDIEERRAESRQHEPRHYAEQPTPPPVPPRHERNAEPHYETRQAEQSRADARPPERTTEPPPRNEPSSRVDSRPPERTQEPPRYANPPELIKTTSDVVEPRQRSAVPPPAAMSSTARSKRRILSTSIPIAADTEFNGGLLRKLRESTGATLEEIAEITKVGKRHLIAIETNDFAALPAAVYTRGFVVEFARVLGLDPTPVAKSFMALFAKQRGGA